MTDATHDDPEPLRLLVILFSKPEPTYLRAEVIDGDGHAAVRVTPEGGQSVLMPVADGSPFLAMLRGLADGGAEGVAAD